MRTIRWLIFFALATAGAAGGGAYWFYSRSDELLKKELLSQLSAMFPDVAIDLDRAHFELSGRVRAHQVKLTFPGDDFASLTVGQLVISLDRDQLAESQQVQIERVRLIKPRAWVIRRADQTWNWQQLRVVRNEGGILPDVEIEHGTVTVQFEQPAPGTPLDINCTELQLTATPSSDRSWAVAASSRVDGTGPVRVKGDFHLDGSPWKMTAEIDGLVIDQALVGKLATIHPALKRPLFEMEARWTTLASGEFPKAEPAANANLGSSRMRPVMRQLGAIPELGVQLLADLKLRMASAKSAGPPEFQVRADIRNGRLTNKMLPLPLHELTGKVYADRSKIVLQELHGRHGESTITCSGKWAVGEQPAVVIHGRRIVVDETLAARLPDPLARLIHSLALRGLVDFDAQLTRTEQGVVVPDIEMTLAQGSLTYEKFNYPVREVSGKLSWHGELAQLEGRGQAGSAPVTVTGTIKRPGPGAEMVILLRADDVPIDAALLNASPAAVKTAVTALNLRGTADAWVKLIKPAGIGAKPVPHIVTRLRDCSVLFDKFPLRIDRISGLVRWDGETATFQSLRGRHADANISCRGSFQKGPEPGKLELALKIEDLPFDSDLFEAIPQRLQETWHEFHPSGRFDALAKVTWVPGGEFDLSIPSAKLKDAEVTLQHFTFPWHNVSAEMSYAHDRLEVTSLRAEHDDCRLRGKGWGTFPCDRPWQFRFEEFFVDDLPTTPAIRRALPADLRVVVDTLNPTGTISVQGPMAFSGPDGPRDSVAIQWKSDVLLSGSDLMLGQRVENIYGRVTLHGAWDGRQAVIDYGQLDLDSLEIFKHQLTEVRGPFKYQQGELTAGSRQAVIGPVMQATKNINVAEQINAKAIDGTLTLNSIVKFGREPDYRLRVIMTGGNLERYTQMYKQGQKNIRGNINGWMDLQGIGDDTDSVTGSGFVKIQPAELYELPVFMQLFQTLGPKVDRTAFKEATFLFTVGKQRFNFQEIDLSGNALRMLGRGIVRFDGVVDLEFYSMLARNQVRVPILSDVIGLLSRGWVGVSVSGDISNPHVEMRAVPEVDDTLRQFLGAFETRPSRPSIRTFAPRTSQAPKTERQ